MLEDKIFKRIEEERLAPKPHWFFLSKDALRMIFSCFAFFGAIISTGLAFYFLENVDWESFLLAPFYIWALLGFVLVFVFVKLIRKFAGLYKFGFMLMLAPIFFANISLGYYSMQKGYAEKMENNLESIPVYEKMIPKRVEEKIAEKKKNEIERKKKQEEEKNVDNEKNNPVSSKDGKKNDENQNGYTEKAVEKKASEDQDRLKDGGQGKNGEKVLGAENSKKEENSLVKNKNPKIEMK